MSIFKSPRTAVRTAFVTLLALAMVTGTVNIPMFAGITEAEAAVNFKDMSNHWAKNYVQKAVDYGFVDGYNDGRFRPDRPITRAEFSKMLNLAIGNEGTAKIGFWDVDPDMWYYADVAKGVSAGYISGYSDTEFAPNKNISRQEAAVMLARIVPSNNNGTTLKPYGDYAAVGSWAVPALQRMTAKNYIGGYNDGNLHPRDNLTRAQAAKIIDDIIDNEKIVKNNQRVVLSGVTLKDTIYANRISVGSDVENGNVTISGCTVLGELNVEGGGSDDNSGITVLNSRIASATVNKASGVARLYAKGDTTIKNTNVLLDAKLESGTLAKNGDFGKGFENVRLSRAANADFIGDFPLVNIEGSKVDMNVSGGTVTKLNIAPTATEAKVKVQRTGTLSEVDANAEGTAFLGDGNIVRLNANANGITYENIPARVITGKGVNTDPTKIAGSEKTFEIKSSPANGATNVAKTSNIKLEFSSQVRLANRIGSANLLNSDQAESVIKFRKNKSNGRSVAFKAEVAGDARSVLIKPDSPLDSNTTYYLVISAGDLVDSFNNKNAEFTVSFTTGVTASEITFSPANGSTSVGLSAMPTIIFSNSVSRGDSGSGSLTPQYLKDSVISFKKIGSNETSRRKVDFTASIDSSNKIITIKPDETLEEEATYYVTINGGSLKYAENKAEVSETTGSFTTISESLISRSVKAKSDNRVTASFTALEAGKVYGIIVPKNDLKKAAPTAASIRNHNYVTSVSNNSKHYDYVSVKAGSQETLDFSDLDANTEYYVYLVLYDNKDHAYSVFEEKVTTSAKEIPIKSLKISVLEAGQTESAVSENISTSSTESEYFIGTQESTTLRVDVNADKSLSPKYSFTCVGGQATGTTMNATNPGYGFVTIPAGTADPGTIQVKVSSDDESYATTIYSIKLTRINSAISSVAVGDLISITSYDNDRQLSVRPSEYAILKGGSRDPIMMHINLAERSNKKNIRVLVYHWYSGGGNRGTYNFVGTADKNGDVQLEGTIGQCDIADGYYKIVVSSDVCGTDSSNMKKTETFTRYYNIDFRN